jgi:hypothetical protein
MARPTALASLSVADLHREIRRRQRTVRTLERRRARLARKLTALDAQIAASGGTMNGSGKGLGATTRARNKGSLADALAHMLKGKQMSVIDAAEAVRRAGYQTTSPNFRVMVNATLLNKKLFKRVDRGVYTAT